MERDEALARIAKPEMDDQFHKNEFEYVANKLGLTVSQLQDIFDGDNKTYRSFRNKRSLIGLGTRALQLVGLEKRHFR
jgi:hypothetical protein